MSYLSTLSSNSKYGAVKIGDNISVSDGIISLPQDIGKDSDVEFSSISADSIMLGSDPVISSIDFSAGSGISILELNAKGPEVSFSITNTGVLSLTAGSGIEIDRSTGNITISIAKSTSVSVKSVNSDYLAPEHDEYIGVSSKKDITISLPKGDDGRVYTIKDEYGAGSGKIKIESVDGEFIDGKSTYVFDSPYQSISIFSRSGAWWVI